MIEDFWGVFRIEFAYDESGKKHCAIDYIKHFWIFTIWGSYFASPSGLTNFRKTHAKQTNDHRVA